MENVMYLQLHNHNIPFKYNFFSKALTTKPITYSLHNSTKHTTLLVETYHQHQALKSLIQRLNNKRSCPLKILQHDGDWTKPHFWAVIRFLQTSSRSTLISEVFDMWKNVEKSRINESNYEKIIGLLCEEGLAEEAVCALEEMKHNGLKPSLKIYNSIIHGYSRSSKFEDALFFLHEMKGIGLKPKTNTYDGLIQSYGKYKMYSKIDMCLKEMKLDGCSPDQFTYNLLIREFARGGLLKRMEGAYKSLRSKRMHFDSSTLVAVLEAYTNFGTLKDMEKVYKSLLKSNAFLKEDLIRKLAEVYIKNHMFSRLDDLGDDLASRTGRTDLVWCLRILSHACLLSRRGMELVVQEMEDARVPWNVSIANIILFSHLKMKDFMHLKLLFSELPKLGVKPDIVTFGILFDARRFGFDETRILVVWRRIGLLDESVQIDTDPLVLTAYGKGNFLKSFEEVYASLNPNAREKKWTYRSLIDLLVKQNAQLLQY
ncbi:hypothetical protein Patl1_26124 [Pistacia atlantica]|uniref:Uncharacterized protein n=1 Tax=Pistacia atlantica TaxID=434234 RepID=A0ACC1B1L3_9ROSI|nr:hypothetical protein Patl1_26124 [Pistacia atlantica]